MPSALPFYFGTGLRSKVLDLFGSPISLLYLVSAFLDIDMFACAESLFSVVSG